MVSEGSKWDQPVAVEINESVRALVAVTSKVQLQSSVRLGKASISVGNASTMESIVGKQEMQRILIGRELQEETKHQAEWHLYKERGTNKLFLRQMTAGPLEYRQGVVDPMSLNTTLLQHNTALDLINKLPATALPPILEEPCI